MIKFTATYKYQNKDIVLRDITIMVKDLHNVNIDDNFLYSLARFAAALIQHIYNIPNFIFASDIKIADLVIK